MEKIFSNILKGEILSSVFYVVFGLCLILIPDQTVNIICKVIFGLILIAAGFYHIVIYAAEKEKATILDLFTGVITAVLGIFLFFTPQIVIKLLPYLLGAFVLVDSIWKLKGTYRMKKAQSDLWKLFLIGTVIFIGLGAAILVYPFLTVPKMILFCGCVLTVNGAADILFWVMMKTVLRKAAKLSKEKLPEKKLSKEEIHEEKSLELKAVETVKTERKESEIEETDTKEVNIEETETDTEETEMQEQETVLDGEWRLPDEELESPRKEIQEMLKSHDEPLEEWKD